MPIIGIDGGGGGSSLEELAAVEQMFAEVEANPIQASSEAELESTRATQSMAEAGSSTTGSTSDEVSSLYVQATDSGTQVDNGSQSLLPSGNTSTQVGPPQQYARRILPSAGKSLRGNAGVDALETLYGPGEREVTFQTQWGGRRVDFVVEEGDTIYAHESNVQADSVRGGTVKYSEILKDWELKQTFASVGVTYQPIWHFWDGPPASKLAAALQAFGIPFVYYHP